MRKFFFFFFFLAIKLFYAQETKPDFIIEIEKDNEVYDIYALDSMFNRYKEKLLNKPQGFYKKYSKEGSFLDYYHSRYHHWRKDYLRYSDVDGIRKNIDPIHNKIIQTKRLTTKNLKTTTPNWTYVGPKEVYDAQGKKDAMQANIYCFDQSITNRDLLFCSVESSGIYKSIDRGVTWSEATKNFPLPSNILAIKIHPTNPNIVITATKDFVIASQDGGTTWQSVKLTTNFSASAYYSGVDAINSIVILPANATSSQDLILISGSRGVYQYDLTTNTLSIYTNFNRPCSDFKANENDFSKVYALSIDIENNTKIESLYISTDGGLTFTKSTNNGWMTLPSGRTSIISSYGGRIGLSKANQNSIYVHLIGIYDNATNYTGDVGFIGLFKSIDAGQTWTQQDSATPGKGPEGYNNGSKTVATTNCNLVSRLEVGDTGFIHQGYYDSALLIDPVNENNVIVGGINSYRSIDGGLSFKALGTGYGQTSTSEIHPDIQFASARTYGTETDYWIATDGGIIYANNDFFSDLQLAEKRNSYLPSEFWGFDVGIFNRIAVGGRFHNGDAIFMTTYGQDLMYVGGGEAATGHLFFNHGERQYAFKDAGVGVASTVITNGVESTETGLTIYPKGNRNENLVNWVKTLTGSFFYYSDDAVVGHNRYLMKVTQNKEEFILKEFETDIHYVGACASNENYLYVMTYDNGSTTTAKTLYRSTDGGQTFTQVFTFPTADTQYRIFVDDVNPLQLWAYGYKTQEFYLSQDGGTTFTSLATAPFDIAQALYQWSSNNIYAIAYNQPNAYRYDIATNTWNSFGSDLPINLFPFQLGITYTDSKLMMATRGHGIWEIDLFSPTTRTLVYNTQKADRTIVFDKNEEFNFTGEYMSTLADGLNFEWTTNSSTATITNANTAAPTIIFNQYGIYDITFKIKDALGNLIGTSTRKVYVYPGCSFDGVTNLTAIPMKDIELWITGNDFIKTDATDGKFGKKIIDKFSRTHGISINKCISFATDNYNGSTYNAMLFGGESACRIEFDTEITDGKTFFLVGHDPTPDIINRNWFGNINGGTVYFTNTGTRKNIISGTNYDKLGSLRLNGVPLTKTQATAINSKPLTPSVLTFTSSSNTTIPVTNIGMYGTSFTGTYKGYLAEVIIYNRELTITEIQKVENYLKKKYLIP